MARFGLDTPFRDVASGELAGATVATQLPNIPCRLVQIIAAYDNAGRVYLGGSTVTVKDGTTDVTSGRELSAGQETPGIPLDNLNRLWRICDNAGDDVTYLVLR